MAEQAVEYLRGRHPSQASSPGVPTLGLRGGLGKTLLTAFLLLAIVPLSLLAFLTYDRIQHDTGARLLSSLETVVALKEAHLESWIESYEHQLALLAGAVDLETRLPALAETMQAQDPMLVSLLLVDGSGGQVLAASGPQWAAAGAPSALPDGGQRLGLITATQGGEAEPLIAVGHEWANRRLVGLLRWEALQGVIAAPEGPEQGITTWLVTPDGWTLSSQGLDHVSEEGAEALPQAVNDVLQGRDGAGLYEGLAADTVFGAYRWVPELGVALLAEYPQAQAQAAGDTVTAMVVGATLAVALITAAIAALVTRRLTRPIVQLTETAAWMARGDLNQQVPVTRRDELGVLARAFNRMAAELRVLYGELEEKVAERTRQLEEAHQRTRYYVMQLSISAEVARVASSIRDVDTLLTTVARLIGNAFELPRVSVYLLDEGGREAVWQAGNREHVASPERETVGEGGLVGQVAADGQRRVVRCADAAAGAACEMAVPLRARQQVLGVLFLESDRANDFDSNDEMVFQSLADQIGVAIENAQAYALERQTVERLRELDRIQSQFLSNMSHALRTPLNSVIGFSRIMLRELDGPLTDLQRTDLTTIYESGRQLLGLINDMLDLSQLELGTAPFSLSEVDLAEIIEGVMATARALAMNKPIQVHEEVPDDLPLVHTDGQRVRQVILALLSNAVKYTQEGSIRLRVTQDDDRVTVSVDDTGIGIPPEERARIFADPQPNGEAGEKEIGFGLAISKRVVERLGGEIWMTSEEGAGSTFTFTLPIMPIEGEQR